MLQAIALTLFTYFMISLGDAFTKKATLLHELLYVEFFSNIACFITIFALAIFNGGYKSFVKTYSLKLQILRALLFLGVYICFLYSIARLEITTLYTLLLTQPFILAVMAHFILKEHIGPHRLLAIIGGFSGVLIVLRPDINGLEPVALVSLLGAFLFSCQNVTTKFMDQRDHWLSYPFYIVAVQTPLLGFALLYINNWSLEMPDLISSFWLGGAGFFYTIGLAFMPLCLRKLDASLFGALEYSFLIWGTALGYLMFAEIPDQWTVLGACIIVASGCYLAYKEHMANKNIKKQG